MGEVRHRRDEAVEVVAADPALHLRETRLDLGALPVGEAEHPRRKAPNPVGAADSAADIVDPAEREALAVGKHGVDREHVVDHVAVAIERAPQELLPVMPPMVQRLAVEGSTGKNSPSRLSRALSRSSTTPGSTVTTPSSGS